jgi:hypothetical protein
MVNTQFDPNCLRTTSSPLVLALALGIDRLLSRRDLPDRNTAGRIIFLSYLQYAELGD